ncbi:MAG: Trm112 family protein [Candidatus Omnitrophica bacterium]|nr:Trm112 family protein [Candidatus Omnitrophota bacterium]
MIDKMLLNILACPACQADVDERAGQIVCLSAACGLKYPIKDGIPVMLVDEAVK